MKEGKQTVKTCESCGGSYLHPRWVRCMTCFPTEATTPHGTPPPDQLREALESALAAVWDAHYGKGISIGYVHSVHDQVKTALSLLPVPAAPHMEAERKRFEQLCYPSRLGLSRNNAPGDNLDEYQCSHVTQAWRAWKLRAAPNPIHEASDMHSKQPESIHECQRCRGLGVITNDGGDPADCPRCGGPGVEATQPEAGEAQKLRVRLIQRIDDNSVLLDQVFDLGIKVQALEAALRDKETYNRHLVQSVKAEIDRRITAEAENTRLMEVDRKARNLVCRMAEQKAGPFAISVQVALRCLNESLPESPTKDGEAPNAQ